MGPNRAQIGSFGHMHATKGLSSGRGWVCFGGDYDRSRGSRRRWRAHWRTHLTYAQGASAELVAVATIGAADYMGLPVSTTHVLSSGVAGTMAANGSGLQWSTVRNLLMAWVLTLPAAIMLSGLLYVLFVNIF